MNDYIETAKDRFNKKLREFVESCDRELRRKRADNISRVSDMVYKFGAENHREFIPEKNALELAVDEIIEQDMKKMTKIIKINNDMMLLKKNKFNMGNVKYIAEFEALQDELNNIITQ